jgi:hypothetical protein
MVKHEPGPHKSSHFVRVRIAHEMDPSARQPGRKPRLTCTFGVEVKGLEPRPLHCEENGGRTLKSAADRVAFCGGSHAPFASRHPRPTTDTDRSHLEAYQQVYPPN